VFGARPLKRLLQKEVLDSLAMKVLGGELRDGEIVTIDNIGGQLTFHANISQAPMVA
jgi:ATP-dependent Clp protease ATP-binding subunit ClpB